MNHHALKVYRYTRSATLPTKAHPSDAGWDLFLDHDVLLSSKLQAIDMGIKLVIPEGYWVRLAEKSGLASLGVELHGGIIDQNYRGPIKVLVRYTGNGNLSMCAGRALCQMILVKQEDMGGIQELTQDEFSTATDRGESGFGASGA